MSVADYSTTASDNTSISGINIAEGCSPANINDAIRQLMADVKEESVGSLKADGSVSATAAVTFSSGDVVKRSTDSWFTRILGSTATKSGAELVLYGNEYALGSNGGAFNLRSCNSSGTFYALRGDSTGALTWGGKAVLVNDGTALVEGANPNPRSIYTFTGKTDSYYAFGAGTEAGDSPYVITYGTTYSTNTARRGAISLRTRNSDGVTEFIAYPGGDLTWSGRNVYTASDNDYVVEERVTNATQYIRWASGVQVCWGTISIPAITAAAAQTGSVTLSYAFRDTAYGATITADCGESGWEYLGGIGITSVAKSSISWRAYLGAHPSAMTARWVAMGRWK